MEPGESCVTITSMVRNETGSEKYVWFATKNGLIKKTALKEYAGLKRKGGLQALGLRAGDSLVSVWVHENSHILMVTKKGMSIRFDGTSIAPTGRTAAGVQGIKLGISDNVAFACPIESTPGERLLVVWESGLGKKVDTNDFICQIRAGKGAKLGGVEVSKIRSGVTIRDDSMVLVSGETSSIVLAATDIKLGNRTSTPIKLIKDNKIVSIARV
jgi:DNA gyrase subunit A